MESERISAETIISYYDKMIVNKGDDRVVKEYFNVVYQALDMWTYKVLRLEPKFASMIDGGLLTMEDLHNTMWSHIFEDLIRFYNPHLTMLTTFFSPQRLISYVTDHVLGHKTKHVRQTMNVILVRLKEAGIEEDLCAPDCKISPTRISRITGLPTSQIITTLEAYRFRVSSLDAVDNNVLRPMAPTLTPEEEYLKKEMTNDLIKAVKTLTPAEQRLIMMHYKEDMTETEMLRELVKDDYYKTIGYNYDLSKQGIQTCLNHAYSKMKKSLQHKKQPRILSGEYNRHIQADEEQIYAAFK